MWDKINDKKVVFITGCSSGIGRACALALDKAGFRVLAGVRNKEEGKRLEKHLSNGSMHVILDVTSDESVSDAICQIEKITGPNGLYGLLNNVATSDFVPIEASDINRLIHIFDINLFGAIRITKGLIPLIRKCKGRIVNISSIGGGHTTPYGFPICATKYALNSFSQVLALELSPWGIDVIGIDPSFITSKRSFRMMDSVHANLTHFTTECNSLYKDSFLDTTKKISNQQSKNGVPPEVVGRVALEAFTSKSPKKKYRVGAKPSLFTRFSKTSWKKAS